MSAAWGTGNKTVRTNAMQYLKGTDTECNGYIWVTNFQIDLTSEIYSKSLVRANGKV